MSEILTSKSSYSSRKRAVNSSNKLLNHLRSILVDWHLLSEVRHFLAPFSIPCIGNSRNGLWYAPEFDGGTCYFKSMDGHNGKWHFSLQRLNLNVAKVALQNRGALIVDSTKAGKRYPDSFSATVPIWCAMINYVVIRRSPGDLDRDAMEECLCTPNWINASSRDQIINACLNTLKSLPKSAFDLILNTCVSALDGSHEAFKPLRPLWVCPNEDGSIEWEGSYADAMLDSFANNTLSFTPIILLSVSGARNSVKYSELSIVKEEYTHESIYSYTYIRGAGDDEESWSQGLTPKLFWDNRHYLLCMDKPGMSASPPDDCFEGLDERVATVINLSKGLRVEINTTSHQECHENKTMNSILITEKLSIYYSPQLRCEENTLDHAGVVESAGGSSEACQACEDEGKRSDQNQNATIHVTCDTKQMDDYVRAIGKNELEVSLSCDKPDKRRHPRRWGVVLKACAELMMPRYNSAEPYRQCRKVCIVYQRECDCESASALAAALLCYSDHSVTPLISVEQTIDDPIKANVRMSLGVVQMAVSSLSDGIAKPPHPPQWVVKEICEFCMSQRGQD